MTGFGSAGLSDAQVHRVADQLLAEAEARLEQAWFGPALNAVVGDLRVLAEYPSFQERCRTDADFAERVELVIAAWKDRPGG